MSSSSWIGHKEIVPTSEIFVVLIIKCSTCPSSCHNLWRYSWPVLWRPWTFSNWRESIDIKIHYDRWFCRSGIQLCWNYYSIISLQIKISWSTRLTERKSWIKEHYLYVWLLWLNKQKVWKSKCLVLL